MNMREKMIAGMAGADAAARGALDYDELSALADAVLATIEAAGFVIVPREPTEAMIEAGVRGMLIASTRQDAVMGAWPFMLAAATHA